jgi:acyl-CoA thioesterase-1
MIQVKARHVSDYFKFYISIPFLIVFMLLLTLSNAKAETLRIVAFGDSLTAGYGLSAGDGFTDQLQDILDAKGYDVKIINAGVSGDTTTSGLARIDWSVEEGTDGVILELGANDALRGVNPAVTRDNLDAMLKRLRERGIPVLFAGMLAPPNMGEAYASQFNPIFEDLATEYEALYYPFFLDGVAANPSLNLRDGIHPNAEGVKVIVERILPSVEALIERIRSNSE